jgi:hypothetical protein
MKLKPGMETDYLLSTLQDDINKQLELTRLQVARLEQLLERVAMTKTELGLPMQSFNVRGRAEFFEVD